MLYFKVTYILLQRRLFIEPVKDSSEKSSNKAGIDSFAAENADLYEMLQVKHVQYGCSVE